MKHLCLVLAVLTAFSLVGMGCQKSSHERYRQYKYRRVVDADVLGLADDVDAAILMTERPTHLSPWYHP